MNARLVAAAAALAVSACATAPEPAAEPRAIETAPERPPAQRPSAPVAAGFMPDETLFICPVINVSNAPAADAQRRILGYKPFVLVEGSVVLALAPVNGACLSSGFGPRRGRAHNGIDFNQDPPTEIYAAGDGRVLEANSRDDFGNHVVIDHGDGVHTRYAHLQNLRVSEGETVRFGAPLGLMGATSAYPVAQHLHYEILVGDYDTPARSFGLTPVDPFSLPMIEAPSEARVALAD